MLSIKVWQKDYLWMQEGALKIKYDQSPEITNPMAEVYTLVHIVSEFKANTLDFVSIVAPHPSRRFYQFLSGGLEKVHFCS